jgi:hypothetical protein
MKWAGRLSKFSSGNSKTFEGRSVCFSKVHSHVMDLEILPDKNPTEEIAVVCLKYFSRSLRHSNFTAPSAGVDLTPLSDPLSCYIFLLGEKPPFSGGDLVPSRLFSEKDLRTMAARGIDIAEVLRQIEIFRRRVEPIKLMRPARIGDGIVQVLPEEREALVFLHNQAAGRGRMLKFVPASGVASRLFNDWQRYYRRGRFDSDERTVTFLRNVSKFAFYDDLKDVMALHGQNVESYVRDMRCADILEYILTEKGLNYAWLPKALLKFHIYPGHNRTAVEEHLAEAALYVRDARNICRTHFTVSEEHESRFRDFLSRVRGNYENLYGVSYEISITTQPPSTDTIALSMNNRPFRDTKGEILFRPGGHGALLQNLNAVEGDIIFLKNIDNVHPDRLKDITVFYKKVLGGYLIRLQDETSRILNLLLEKGADDAELSSIVRFCRERLFVSFPDGFTNCSAPAKKEYIFQKLNRPIRVCGMVRNEGEPGGGPFWVEEKDGTESLQIVDQNQIDSHSKEQQHIWRSSTHFNPVDLVCGVRDYRGEKFDLRLYANRDAVSISVKPYEKGELKALELPGLWNGSMAFWNTIFVEVPLETFNPVKTVDDLLRTSHLPS